MHCTFLWLLECFASLNSCQLTPSLYGSACTYADGCTHRVSWQLLSEARHSSSHKKYRSQKIQCTEKGARSLENLYGSGTARAKKGVSSFNLYIWDSFFVGFLWIKNEKHIRRESISLRVTTTLPGAANATEFVFLKSQKGIKCCLQDNCSQTITSNDSWDPEGA